MRISQDLQVSETPHEFIERIPSTYMCVKKRRSKTEYINYTACFDIETTNTDIDGFAYSFQLDIAGVTSSVTAVIRLEEYLPEGPQLFPEGMVTDQPERQIVAELIREKALHALNEEIPHGIAVSIDQMKKRKGRKMFDIDATIICERDSHKGIIIGKQGAMLKKIGTNARYEIEHLLDAKVNLKLWVKVKKDWRDSDYMIKNFGYREEEF